MRNNIIILLAGILLFSLNIASHSQTKAITELCSQHISPPFVSNGQQYRALLKGNEKMRFETTFYGGNTYRIATYGGLEAGNVIFRVYDEEENLLYTNAVYDYSPYWDFGFINTMNCTIEIQLNQERLESGIIAMLIGFKKQ